MKYKAVNKTLKKYEDEVCPHSVNCDGTTGFFLYIFKPSGYPIGSKHVAFFTGTEVIFNYKKVVLHGIVYYIIAETQRDVFY